MKTPRENVQLAKKGNGSSKLAGMMANAFAEENVDAPSQKEMIAVAAYFRAEQRGFEPGSEIQDWLEAEEEFKSGFVDTD
jgi:hypothetical protein